MLWIRRKDVVEDRLDVVGESFDLVGAETTIVAGWAGRPGLAVSYRRAVGVDPAGDGARIPIRDHVMTTKMIVCALVALAATWRFTPWQKRNQSRRATR